MAGPTVSVSVNVDGFRQLAERLRTLAAESPEKVRALFIRCAEVTLTAAEANASGSKKTVETLKVVETPGVSAAVQAGGGDSPLPALRERGSRSRPGPTWRHPAWGTWKVHDSTRLTQKTHPYLAPAMASTREANLLRVARGVEEFSNETLGEELPE